MPDSSNKSMSDLNTLSLEQYRNLYESLLRSNEKLLNSNKEILNQNREFSKTINEQNKIIAKKDKVISAKEKTIRALIMETLDKNKTIIEFIKCVSVSEFKRQRLILLTVGHQSEKSKNTDKAHSKPKVVSDVPPGRPKKSKDPLTEEQIAELINNSEEIAAPDDPSKYCAIPNNVQVVGEYAIFTKYITSTQREKKTYKFKIISIEEFKKKFPNAEGIDNYKGGLVATPDAFAGSVFTPSSAAQIATDHTNCNVTLGNIEKYHFSGTTINKSMISKNLAQVAEWFTPIVVALEKKLRESYIAHSDETHIQVQNYDEDNAYIDNAAKKRSKSYIYCFITGIYEKLPVVLYRFFTTRQGDEAKVVFNGSQIKYLVTDGYDGYNKFQTALVRCWVHVRRYFEHVVDIDQTKTISNLARNEKLKNKLLKENDKAVLIAQTVIDKIKEMYKKERLFAEKGYDPSQIKTAREKQTRPIVDSLFSYLEKHKDTDVEKLHVAIRYALDYKDDLYRFFEDGRLPLDNNLSERNIRPIVTYRNNSYFCTSEQGAKTLCTLKTVSITAMMYGLEPTRYIKFLLEKIHEDGHFVREKTKNSKNEKNKTTEKFVAGNITQYVPWSPDLPESLYYTKEEIIKIKAEAQEQQNEPPSST
jgi:hypothetical protein